MKAGRLVVIGIAQEQHKDRCRLFAQWQRLDFPILHDPINLTGNRAVPMYVAVDEHGIVRSTRPRLETFEARFLDRTFDAPEPAATRPAKPAKVDPAKLKPDPEAPQTAAAWRGYGDALVLWGRPEQVDEAIDAYGRAVKLDATDGAAHFRIGVCYRLRYESRRRKPGDAGNADQAWAAAATIDRKQYIWRRRIEQYGPKSARPYLFYDWTGEAASEIVKRGEKPAILRVPVAADTARPGAGRQHR